LTGYISALLQRLQFLIMRRREHLYYVKMVFLILVIIIKLIILFTWCYIDEVYWWQWDYIIQSYL